MITEDKVESFISFYDAGGLVEAENLTKGLALLSVSGSVGPSYSATVESEADYTSDGVKRLPDAILALSGELSLAASKLPGWNGYITLASEPTDLEQVSQGAKVYRIVEGRENDTIWPSILPITSKPEIAALEQAISDVQAHLASTQTLMTEINASVWPDPVSVPNPDGTESEVRYPVPLTQDQKNRCLAHATVLEAEIGKVGNAANAIGTMTQEATSKRALALEYFEKAVTFTIASNQVDRPDIGPATKEVFKHY
jgi:hypothetical protein